MVPAVRAADGSDTAPCPIPIPTGLATFMSIRWDVAARAWPFRLRVGGLWRAVPSGDTRGISVSRNGQEGIFTFLEKKLQGSAEGLWGLVQLHFWRMVEDRQ